MKHDLDCDNNWSVPRPQSEAKEAMDTRLLNQVEEGLEVINVEGKGRGVAPTRPFAKGELLCEYSGELITAREAYERNAKYTEKEEVGCYMYYFRHNDTKWW